MSRPVKVLLILLAGISLGAGAWAFWTYRLDQDQLTRLNLVSQVLTGVYNQSRIQTAEAFYQVLFPFDFFPQDPKAWRDLKIQALQRRPIPPSDWETLDLVRLARKIGYDPDLGKYGFLVLNIHVKAGMDLEKTPLEARVEGISGGRTLMMDLPVPLVTDFVVADLPEGTRFPGPNLSPLDWKQLIEKLKPRILTRVLQDGLLQKGKDNAKDIFERILRSSEITDYEINWKIPADGTAADRG